MVTNASNATQTTMPELRRSRPVLMETPTPVIRLIAAMKHSGHFGITARTTLGRTHAMKRIKPFGGAVVAVRRQQKCLCMAVLDKR